MVLCDTNNKNITLSKRNATNAKLLVTGYPRGNPKSVTYILNKSIHDT
jgi:hypothetical protein